jgi:hypothetical protein
MDHPNSKQLIGPSVDLGGLGTGLRNSLTALFARIRRPRGQLRRRDSMGLNRAARLE